jgi:VWFA-related protein
MGQDALRFAGLVGATALALPLFAQSPGPQEVPVFQSAVTVVAVPVFVTDKSGKAVPGLGAADFEVEEQGRKVPLAAFQAVDAMSRLPAAEAGTLIQATARRQFLLLFDLTFSTPVGIKRAQDAASTLVRGSLAPSDLAAVATFGQAGVQVLVAFTTDHAQLARAIAGLGIVDTQRLRDPLGIAYDLGVERWGPGLGAPSENQLDANLRLMAQLMARSEQAQYRQRVDGFLAGLAGLARTLDAVHGRKQVILLSAGFDSSVVGGAQGQEAEDAALAVVEGRLHEVLTDRSFGDSTTRGTLDRLFQTLAATDTVIHSVDVGGMVASTAVDQNLPVRTGQGRDTLAQFAENTGGRFVKDANDLRTGLQEILDASSHYYVLAFEPTDAAKNPDRVRKLKVRVKRDGLSVSYRRAYVIPDSKRDAVAGSGQLQAAEAIAKGLSGGAIALRALAVPYRDARGSIALPVILEIDGRTLLSGAASKQLQLEVFGYAFDDAGHIYDAFGLTPTLDLAKLKPSLERRGLQVLSSFAVPAGPVDLRFLVREKASGRAGSLRVRLEVPAFEAGRMVLSPTLAMDDPRTRLVLPAASRGRPGLEIPFRLAETPFTADALPILRNDAARELCVMAWGGETRYGRGEPYRVEAELVDDAGVARALPLVGAPRVVQDADGLERYVVGVVARGVAPGRYDLRLLFRDPATGATARSELPVQFE